MKLLSFRIQNYRSIVDSGWNTIASDNITALIGQNESGKTSVLESLKSFYVGEISDDILRSDLSMPLVHCSFSVDEAAIHEVFKDKKVPAGLYETLLKKKEVTIVRKWLADKSNIIELGGEEEVNIYETYFSKIEEQNIKLNNDIDKLLETYHNTKSKLSDIEHELEQITLQENDELNASKEIQKKLDNPKTSQDTASLTNLVDQKSILLEQLSIKKGKVKDNIEKLKDHIDENAQSVKYATLTREAINHSNQLSLILDKAHEELNIAEDLLEAASTSRELKVSRLRMEKAKEHYVKTSLEYEKASENMHFHQAITMRILKGQSFEEAKDAISQEDFELNNFHSREELGNDFFKYIPEFELFEDFSSLLPNKIDLDDLLNENTSVEGYKAAKNFFIISGVTDAFFQEKNSRILKQKIENLNSELTIDFQDYWRQNVGKNNKIKINFELEHYDYNHPDKKGKPYLEFWVKDEKERLYPKQRSRGVRWFLSFYLELKATAIEKKKNRILLIDEPALSLHARAQEDVLKVFEDIKNELVIIYTTHSPHLIDINKIYRLLAVQRAIEDDDSSETVIFDAKSISRASTDTLSPLYTLMGAKFTDQQFIQKKNNVIVEDSASFYYMQAFCKLTNFSKKAYFIPASSTPGMVTLANLLMGWKLDFVIMTSGNQEGDNVAEIIKKNFLGDNPEKISRKLLQLENKKAVIDLFSTIDFKNHILRKRIGITETNSEYVINNDLSPALLAITFNNEVQDGKISYKDLDDETRNNISGLMAKLENILE